MFNHDRDYNGVSFGGITNHCVTLHFINDGV